MMLAPMIVLAGLCLLLGTAPTIVAPLLDSAVHAWGYSGAAPSLVKVAPLNSLSVTALLLLAALLVLALWLYRRTRRAVPGTVGTWDCGYAASTARIQYTASSFADSLLRLFAWALRPRIRVQKLAEPFPQVTKFHSETPDVALDLALVPAIAAAGRAFSWLRWIQQGSVHVYLLYILLTLIVFMLWR
jgi:hydrogenase-4 component B